jgi:hypothetical protein
VQEKNIIKKPNYDFVDKELADFLRQKDLDTITFGKPFVNEGKITLQNGLKVILGTI